MKSTGYLTASLVLSASSLVTAALNLRGASHQLSPRDDYLAFCYGTNSICETAVAMYKQCNGFANQKDQAQYRQCLCGNGWVSSSQACQWCDVGYDPSKASSANDLATINVALCSSYSATIAPIPTSALLAYASHNATFTGSVPGVTASTAQRTSSSGKSTISSGSASVRTSGSLSVSASTSTSGGNGLTTQTFNGGGSVSPTTTASLAGVAGSSTGVAAATTSVRSGAVRTKGLTGDVLCLVLGSGLAATWL